jgi:hypothetical protein
MSTLEIIHLRASSEPATGLTDRIRESLSGEGRNPEEFVIYRRDGLAADLAIHIRHRDDCDLPSTLGLQLVATLEDFGMVTHSVWHEMGNNNRHSNDRTVGGVR